MKTVYKIIITLLFPILTFANSIEETIVGEKNYDAEDAFLDELEENEMM